MNTDEQLSFRLATHGGRRVRAGRKPGARPKIRHRSRAEVSQHRPALVTLKVRRGLGSLRKRRIVSALSNALYALKARKGFRVVQFSLQADHAHFLVEADDVRALGRGMMALGSRLARIAQRELRVRGRILVDRYHLRVLHTPREVRAALAYVLLNARKHAAQLGRLPLWRIDPASSGAWFTGWLEKPRNGPLEAMPVAEARTWLLREGWRRHGPIDASEIPGFALQPGIRLGVFSR